MLQLKTSIESTWALVEHLEPWLIGLSRIVTRALLRLDRKRTPLPLIITVKRQGAEIFCSMQLWASAISSPKMRTTRRNNTDRVVHPWLLIQSDSRTIITFHLIKDPLCRDAQWICPLESRGKARQLSCPSPEFLKGKRIFCRVTAHFINAKLLGICSWENKI